MTWLVFRYLTEPAVQSVNHYRTEPLGHLLVPVQIQQVNDEKSD